MALKPSDHRLQYGTLLPDDLNHIAVLVCELEGNGRGEVFGEPVGPSHLFTWRCRTLIMNQLALCGRRGCGNAYSCAYRTVDCGIAPRRSSHLSIKRQRDIG